MARVQGELDELERRIASLESDERVDDPVLGAVDV